MGTVEIAGIPVQTFTDDPGWVPPTNLVLTPTTRRNLQKILYPLNQGYNLLLVGDAGVGKNALIYYINQIRKHPTVRYSFNEDTLPDDLVGAYKIEPISHSFVWSDGPLSHALRNGSTFVADEMNLAPPEVLKRFYSVFTDGYLQLLEGDASIIKAAQGFNFVATQNPAEGFEGRKNLPREIQKYFATVYIDAYPDGELVDILRGLYPAIAPGLEKLVVINNRVEEQIITRKLGQKDLERYHFNLRNLNRLAARIVDNADEPDQELLDIYLRTFRVDEDRNLVREIVQEELTNVGEGETAYSIPANPDEREIEINVDSESRRIAIGRAVLQAPEPSNGRGFREIVEDGMRRFPPVTSRRHILEAIARGIQMGENVLLESHPDVEPENYIEFFCDILGVELTTITLSRGMHTADILGGLKPKPDVVMDDGAAATESVRWVDGPLTEAVRKGGFILLKGLEAAGPELVEKLNMLTDDARALMLPPESGSTEPLLLKEDARVFGIKYFRTQRSTPSISRAFRNRFSCLTVTAVTDEESLKEIVMGVLGLQEENDAVRTMTGFHRLIRERSRTREIGAGNLQPYQFGLTNLERWGEHIVHTLNGESDEDLQTILLRGAAIAYINEISDPVERDKTAEILMNILAKVELDELLDPIKEGVKKKSIKSKTYSKKINWDQQAHFREANTGKAEFKMNGRELKQGVNINTPETGGNTKEGEDAWYGSDTQGNKGQGEPGGGGGAWGYRTDELYKEFLKKRKALWEYNLGVSLRDFKETFGPEIDRVVIDFDRLVDPKIDINRRYLSQGSRLDARRYLSYLAGKGDGRVFDKTSVTVEEDRLKGVEIGFALNKGRRIYNFDYSIATLVAIMSCGAILDNHSIPFGVVGYSDLKNDKRTIDLTWFKDLEVDYTMDAEETLFDGLAENWHGDTIAEASILDEMRDRFTPHARTRILILISDFRGPRGKVDIQKDLESPEARELKKGIDRLADQGVVSLGVGVGPRHIAEHLFHESLQIGGENFANLPALLANTVTELIHRHHNAAVM